MPEPTTEDLFAAFRETGDPQALAAVFDRLAPQLLLVAAHLVGGDLAQDLVQATFLDAMRQCRRWDGRRLAAWLTGILGNHVREARRQRRRVPDPQRLPTRVSTTPRHDAEANECFAAVAAAVEALPRHYRQVLTLRLVHGFELQQIAHALDAPLGTVKVRLHRGLAHLRRALPAGLTATLAVLVTPTPGLAAARQFVLAEATVAWGSRTAVGAGVVLGGLAMQKLVVGVVALAIVAVGWFVLDPFGRAHVAVAPPAPPASLVHADSTLREPTPTAAAEGAVPSPMTGSAAAPTVDRSEAPTTGTLVVQVVWISDGQPAPWMQVATWERGDRKSVTAVSDATGHATFTALSPGNYRLLASRAKNGPEDTSVEVSAGTTATVRLAIGGDVRLHVTVVDRDGATRRGAAVWCNDSYAQDELLRCLGTTDADGKLEWRGLPLHEVWARATGCQPSPVHALPDFPSGEVPAAPIAVRLTLGGDGCTLLGSVVDPQGGPAAGARVAVAIDDTVQTRWSELLLTTDAQGRFRVDELPAGERFVVASLPEFAPAIVRVTTSTDEPETVALQLRTGVTLTGRVTNADGEPIVDTIVTASAGRAVVGMRSPWGDHRLTRTDTDGRYRLPAIVPGEITARMQGTPELLRELAAADGEVLVWDVTREPERVITGRIVDSEDRPLVGWTVHATSLADQFLPVPRDTDTAGRFRITGLRDDSYRLVVAAPVVGEAYLSAAAKVPRAIIDDVRPSPEPRTIRIDADGMAAGWLEGTLALPDGLQVEAELSLYPKALASKSGFVVPQQQVAAGQTTFRIGPLPAGEYDLFCAIEGRSALMQRGLRLAANATLRLPPFAFDAQRPQVILLRHADGRPAAGAVVQLRSYGPCRETSPGRYESAATEPGADEVLVHGPDFLAASMPVTRNATSTPIELEVRAATPVVVHLSPPVPRERWIGALTVRLTDANGTELVHDLVQIDCSSEFRWPIGLAPGSYTLHLSAYGDGSVTTTLVVGSAPQQVALQLVK
ncbi:MAG: sigma-70 family RNA polymerase sigma factor [Planctomycetes bacterium]|nr:sigma-70 family RNA polymerase sigma factor [Planctomycetota bacterium]